MEVSDAAADILAGSDDDDGDDPRYILTAMGSAAVVAFARAIVAKRNAVRRCRRELKDKKRLLLRGDPHRTDICSLCRNQLGAGSLVFTPAACTHQLHAVCCDEMLKVGAETFQNCPSCRTCMFDRDHLLDATNELLEGDDGDDDSDENV